MSDLMSKLKAPFPEKVIHWRVGSTDKKKQERDTGNKNAPAQSGIALAYVNARDVMKRLDDVCGLEWQDRYPYAGCCEIGIKVDGEWIWKSDGAGETDFEGEKGRFSDAFKRAAVKWGIGRYLYYLDAVWMPLKNGRYLSGTPKLPNWAIAGKGSEPYTKQQKADFDTLMEGEPLEFWLFLSTLPDETKLALYSSFEKGHCCILPQ